MYIHIGTGMSFVGAVFGNIFSCRPGRKDGKREGWERRRYRK